MLKIIVLDDKNEADHDAMQYYENPHKAYSAIGEILFMLRKISKYSGDFMDKLTKEIKEYPPDQLDDFDPKLNERDEFIAISALEVIREEINEIINGSDINPDLI
jgi:hypothetical protein